MNDFFSTKLSSGLEVVAQPLAGVQSAAIAFFIGAGARNETESVSGLAHLAESTMFRGTTTMSSRQLTDEFDKIGVARGSSTGIETTMFSGIMLGNYLPRALELFIEVLRRASFPAEELEVVRGLQLQEINQRNDQPASLVMDRSRKLFFAGHPIGNDTLGTPDSVLGLERDRVIDFWRSRFASGNMLLSVAGSFDWEELTGQLEEQTAGWAAGNGRETPSVATPAPSINVEEADLAQENMAFVFPAVPVGDPQYYAVYLMSLAFGGGMNSRLHDEVREKRGLVYSVGARFDPMERNGIVRIYAGTTPERARQTVEVIRAEIDKLVSGGLTDEELDLAKTHLKSRLVMASESTGNRAMAIGRDWWFNRRFRTLQQIREEIDAVTLHDVSEFLHGANILENLGIAALGPANAIELGLDGQSTRPVATG